METNFARHARTHDLSSLQRELVIASLLGDAYLMRTTSGYCFRIHHGLHQRAYVEWKYSQLVQFVRTAPRAVGRSSYFRTITHPDLTEIRSVFYGDANQKTVPLQLLFEKLGAFGLAVWFMDDGSAEGRQFRLNTQSFTLDENLGLAEFLRAKFGITARLNRDKDRYRLRITSESSGRFKELVSPFVIPEMLYKLFPVTTSRVEREMEITAPRGQI